MTLAQAIEVYIAAYDQKFTQSQLGVTRKRQRLQRFLTYLADQQHSLQLRDLTTADGVAFLRSLIHNSGTPLSPSTLADYKGGMRTFSRFLFKSHLLPVDIFFDLTLEM